MRFNGHCNGKGNGKGVAINKKGSSVILNRAVQIKENAKPGLVVYGLQKLKTIAMAMGYFHYVRLRGAQRK